MGGRTAKTRPRQATSLKEARDTVAGLETWLHSHLKGLNLPSDPVDLISALQELDEDSLPYFAAIYLEIARDVLDSRNTDPDYVAAVPHVAVAATLIADVRNWRETFNIRLQRSAAGTKGTQARPEKDPEKDKERLRYPSREIDKRILTDPAMSDRVIARQLKEIYPDLGLSTLLKDIQIRRVYLESRYELRITM